MQSVQFNLSGLNEERQSSTKSSRKGKTASTRTRTKSSDTSTKRSRTSAPKALHDETQSTRVTFGQSVFHNIELEDEECQDILTMDEENQPAMELPVLDRYDEDFEAENRDSWIAYDEIDLNEKSQEDCEGGDLESGSAIDPRSKAVEILSKLEEAQASRKNRCRMIRLGVLGLLFMIGVTILIVVAVDLLTVPNNTSAPVPSTFLEDIQAATVDQVSSKSAPIRKIPIGEGILLGGPSDTGPTSRSSAITSEPPQSKSPLTLEGEGIPTPRSSIMNFRVDHSPNQQSTGTGPPSPNRQVKPPQSKRPTGTSPTTRSSTTSTRQPPQARPKSLRFVDGKWVSAGN